MSDTTTQVRSPHANGHITLSEPPGPRGHWLTGTAAAFRQAPLKTLVQYHAQYGDAVRFRFFPGLYGYTFVHPDHNQHVLQDNNRNYTKIPSPSFVILQPILGNGLLTSDGETWLRQRRLAQPAFHRQRIASFGDTMTAAAGRVLDRLRSPAGQHQVVDLSQIMTGLTLEIVGRTLFSIDLTGEAAYVGEAFTEVNHLATEFTSDPLALFKLRVPFWPTTRRLLAGVRRLDVVVNRIIADRRAEPEPGEDLLGMLMAARDETTGAGMDDRQLRDEVMTLLLAGHETTAVALSWIIYLLSTHPEVARRLEAEVDEVLAGRTPAMADLAQLPYARMIIDEALRLYPPAYVIARWGHEPDQIGQWAIPANSSVLLIPFVTHRLPAFWDEPDRFDPERFTPENAAGRPRYAYLPFGGGPRQCIGNTFALVETQLILTMLVQRYRWTLVEGYEAAMEPLITLRPLNGVPVQLENRE